MLKQFFLNTFCEQVPVAEAPEPLTPPKPSAKPASLQEWLRGLLYEEVLDDDDLYREGLAPELPPIGAGAGFDSPEIEHYGALEDLDISADSCLGYDGEFDPTGCFGLCDMD